MVTSVSNKVQVQDHYPVVSEPGGEYVTHVLLPPYPSNTQRVEQMVRVVTEASTARVGYEGRQSLIVQKLKSRKLVKSFNSKMQDAKFD